VLTAVSTSDGLDLVAEAPGRTLVITDAMRIEGGRRNVHAGMELIGELRESHPEVPVVVFAGPDTVRHFRPVFLEAGARDVTDRFVELADVVATTARQRFRAIVGQAVGGAGGAPDERPPQAWILELRGGTRVRVEARDWRRTPTASAVDRVWARAERLIQEGHVARVVVVVPVDRVLPRQKERAPQGASVVALAQLDALLAELTGESATTSA